MSCSPPRLKDRFILPYSRTHPYAATGTSSLAWPFDMVPVDDQRMLMTDRGVPVRMGVRFRPFPPLMGMLVVLVMNMEVFVPEGHMDVLDLYCISRRPEPHRERRRHDRQYAQHYESSSHAGHGPDPSGQRIGRQPAGMAEGELCGEQSGTVFRMS